jgi:hypothetical protein
MKIRQYRPAFVTGFDNETSYFSSVEDLQKIPWVANFAEPIGGGLAFDGFFHGDQKTLMAVYGNNKEWWVVGFADVDLSALGIPKWTAPADLFPPRDAMS